VGSEIAGYRLESLIQRGGMAVVYLAEHIRLGRKVALKLLALELSEDDKFRERFLRESRLAARINHPNIIPIYDAGESDGLLYIAMLYVGEFDLKKLVVKEGPLDTERAVSLVMQAGAALDSAHKQGLIHRDVKPANILVVPRSDADGHDHVYLTDFGLTKHAGSRSGLTATGQFVGTIDYVAPEQIEGKEVDSRADVYSLGCVLYECLTGTMPFRKDDEVAVLYAHMKEQPPRVSDHRPELPSAIDGVIAKVLAKSPDERFQTCAEFTTAARAALRVSESSLPSLTGDAHDAISDEGSTSSPTLPDDRNAARPQGEMVTGTGPPLRPTEAQRPRASGSSPPVAGADPPDGTRRPATDRAAGKSRDDSRRFPVRSALTALVAFALGIGIASAYFLLLRNESEVYRVLVLEHLPSGPKKCDQVDPKSPVSEGILDADGVLAEARCDPEAGIEARYFLIHSAASLSQTFYQLILENAAQPSSPQVLDRLDRIHESAHGLLKELSATEAFSGYQCRTQTKIVNVWANASSGSAAHQEVELPPQEGQVIGGFVGCYVDSNGANTMVWTDNQTTILTIATGSRRTDLYDWWSENSGPEGEREHM
jgi:serine/threonine-protein kinase